MALSIVTSSKEISKYHDEFAAMMRANASTKPRKLYFSTRGGNGEIVVYYNSRTNIWWANGRGATSKYYNLFGMSPDYERNNHLLLQINYQKKFETFHEAAFWAKDEKGKIFLLHNGKMGGGVKGFTYERIDYLYSGRRCNVKTEWGEFDSYFVCELGTKSAYKQVSDFVHEINWIKNVIKGIIPENNSHIKNRYSLNFKEYFPEFWGKRKSYQNTGKIKSTTNHGLIVDLLKNELATCLPKVKFVKNSFIDLGIVVRDKPTAIFEIKTSITRYTIYTAIGQLLLHSNTWENSTNKFLVVPDDIDSQILVDIEYLGIEVITFSLKRNNVLFNNLNRKISVLSA